MKDTKYYTHGCQKLYLATDHKTLVGYFRDKSLADIENKNLAELKEKTMCGKFDVVNNPGKSQNAADGLSRCKPLHTLYITLTEEEGDEKDLMEVMLDTVGVAMQATSVLDGPKIISLHRVYKATKEDHLLVF